MISNWARNSQMQISELLARMEGVGAEGLGSATFFFFFNDATGLFLLSL